jgi:hypothetical protein
LHFNCEQIFLMILGKIMFGWQVNDGVEASRSIWKFYEALWSMSIFLNDRVFNKQNF